MKTITSNQIENIGTTSDGQAWLAIRYLDPGLRRQRQFATGFVGLAALIVWGVLIGLLFFL